MKKSIAMRIIVGIAVFLIGAVCVLLIGMSVTKKYNETFPEKYIAETYPDVEILNSGYSGGFMFDRGNLYYECYDNNTGMRFNQQFVESGFFGRLKPRDDNYDGYNAISAEWEAENRLIGDAESCLEAEHFIIHNPMRTSGIVIFAKNESAENIDLLMRKLNTSISDERRYSGIYTAYTIISCGDRLYEQVQTIDYKNFYSGKSGQCDFFDIAEKLDIAHERITSVRISELDYDVYDLPGDPCDENYRPADEFDETAVCMIGEVNAIGDQHMWVFGVDL